MGSETGTLFLVGTPIGNLGDITERARETLAAVDIVAAEDTRRTGRLLAHLGVRARTVSLFEGNERRRSDELLHALRQGEDVAVVSDAGMPGLSDPGFRLVRMCVEAGIAVRVVPGPSAAIAALVVSGLPTDRFAFEGFLPRRAGDRTARLETLASDPRTVVFFESPRRIRATLEEARRVLGDRRIALARELTKLHEEVLRGSVSEVLDRLTDHELRGELVLVVDGARPDESEPDAAALADEARRLVDGGLRPRAAAGEVGRRHGVAPNRIYEELVRRR
jgi:16S rRNA (cytidine1402-2'-O)-methyltransferase